MTRLSPSVLSIALVATVSIATHAQARNPLAGGVWERYSFKTADGVETGGPGWFFLTFTDDGHFFIIGVPKDRKLSKPIAEMTREELVRHFETGGAGLQVRRGRYTVTGGPLFTLILRDEANPMVPGGQGSCPPSAPCQFRIVDGEVHLGGYIVDPTNKGGARWRGVK